MSVGLNTNLSGYGLPAFGNSSVSNNGIENSNNKGSLFNMPPVSNAYDDDIMISNLNFGSLAGAAYTNLPQNTCEHGNLSSANFKGLDPSFSGNASDKTIADQGGSNSVPDTSELNGYLTSKNGDGYAQTENGAAYKKSNTAKIAGFTLGALAPATGKFIDWFKGGSFKALFKSKHLAIACPIVALGGLAVGALVDNNINTKRAMAADKDHFANFKQVSNSTTAQSMNNMA